MTGKDVWIFLEGSGHSLSFFIEDLITYERIIDKESQRFSVSCLQKFRF